MKLDKYFVARVQKSSYLLFLIAIGAIDPLTVIDLFCEPLTCVSRTGHMSTTCMFLQVIDMRDLRTYYMKQDDFFEAFKSGGDELQCGPGTRHKAMLKVKDFPPTAHFAEVLPRHWQVGKYVPTLNAESPPQPDHFAEVLLRIGGDGGGGSVHTEGMYFFEMPILLRSHEPNAADRVCLKKSGKLPNLQSH